MDFWSAIVAIMAIIFMAEIVKHRANVKIKTQQLDPKATSKIEELEKRIQSLETIILEMDKENRFRDLK